MALRYLLDEDLRGVLWKAIQFHNSCGINPLDVLRAGDPPALPLGTADPDHLLWAEQQGRIIVTMDKTTMPGHLAQHLQSGHHSPGVMIVRPDFTVLQIVDFLAVAAYGSDPADWQDRIDYIP